MNKKYDILGLGCAAVDDFLYVDAYPPADGKAQVRRRERHCGGLSATALVAGARLGGKCAYAGTLGEDEMSDYVLEVFKREKVDVRHVVRRGDARPIRSTIVVEERCKTRAIFFDIDQVRGADDKLPAAEVIRASRVLLVDDFGMPGMIRAARIARAAGIPVVADFETGLFPGFSTLLKLVNHLVLSETFACKWTGVTDPSGAAAQLWNEEREVVIITCGARGCLYVAGNGHRPKWMPAFKVKALDTTGCGDVFHGAYALALARNLGLSDRLGFAAAAAALKAMRHGGQAGIPSLKEVEKFLKQSRP